jgi:hypothetical protein
VLSAEEARKLLDSIETTTLIGMRDCALVGVMVYSFARVGVTVAMRVGDFFQHRKRDLHHGHERRGGDGSGGESEEHRSVIRNGRASSKALSRKCVWEHTIRVGSRRTAVADRAQAHRCDYCFNSSSSSLAS